MFKYKSQKVEIEQLIATEIICNNCNKIQEIKDERKPENWYSFVSGHNSWGNDSCETVGSYDFCCLKCLINGLQNSYLRLNQDHSFYADLDDLTADNMKEIIKELTSKGDD